MEPKKTSTALPPEESSSESEELDEEWGQCCNCGRVGSIGHYCDYCLDSGMIYESRIQESAIPRSDTEEEEETAEEGGEVDTPEESSEDPNEWDVASGEE